MSFTLPDARVSLDEVNGQHFCEIEATSRDAGLGAIAQRLGLEDDQVERRSYAELFGEQTRPAT